MSSSTYGQTHEVTNQAPPLERYNAMTTDAALVAALEREGAAWHLDALTRDGLALTQPDVLALADLANRHTPEHHPFGARRAYGCDPIPPGVAYAAFHAA